MYRYFGDNIELIYLNMWKGDHKLRRSVDRGTVCNNPLKDTGDCVLYVTIFGLLACWHTQRSRQSLKVEEKQTNNHPNKRKLFTICSIGRPKHV